MKSFCAAGANAQAFGASASANVAASSCLLSVCVASHLCRNACASLAKLLEFDHGDLIVAINTLKDLGAQEAAPRLLALLRETSNGQLLGTLCEALGQLGETAAAVDVIKLLDDERPGVRRAAAWALGRMRVRKALGQLERLAKKTRQRASSCRRKQQVG